MLGLSFNQLTTDQAYSFQNREKFPQQVPKQSFLKPKIFSGTFIVFLKSTQSFEHCEKKIIFRSSIFPELLILKNLVT